MAGVRPSEPPRSEPPRREFASVPGVARGEARANEWLGQYELLERLGVGGMAEVFIARRSGPHGFVKRVALKCMLPDLVDDARFLDMFCDEARVMATLHHPNLVQVLDFGEVDGRLFMALEYVDGLSCAKLLRAVAAKGRVFPHGAALYIAGEVLGGLAYAHEYCDEDGRVLSLVHRDVSPGNILIGRTGEVKLTDFGILKSEILARRTLPGELKGKLGYMSPEQVVGAEVDARSDLFTLGIVLAEMLLARPLFPGRNELDVLSRIYDGDLGVLDRHGATLPRVLQDILRRALARDQRDRYSSAREFRGAVHGAMAQLGVAPSESELLPWLHEARVLPSQSGTRPRVTPGASVPRPGRGSIDLPPLPGARARLAARPPAPSLPHLGLAAPRGSRSFGAQPAGPPPGDSGIVETVPPSGQRGERPVPPSQRRESARPTLPVGELARARRLLEMRRSTDAEAADVGPADAEASARPDALSGRRAVSISDADLDHDSGQRLAVLPQGDGGQAPLARAPVGAQPRGVAPPLRRPALRSGQSGFLPAVLHATETARPAESKPAPGGASRPARRPALPQPGQLGSGPAALGSHSAGPGRAVRRPPQRSPELRLALPGQLPIGPISLPQLLGMAATGAVPRGSRVSVDGGAFGPVESQPALGRIVGRREYRLEVPAVAPAWSIEITGPSLACRLFELAAIKATGLVALTGPARGAAERASVKHVYFSRGRPVCVLGSAQSELLGARLVATGEIREEVLEQALVRSAMTGRRLGEELVLAGALRPPSLLRAVAQQVEERVLEAGRWRRGRAEFFAGVGAAPDLTGQAPDSSLWVRLVRECFSPQEVEAWLQLHAGRGVERTQHEAAELLLRATHSPEALVLEFCDASPSLAALFEQLADDGVAQGHEARRAVFLGLIGGWLRLSGSRAFELPSA